MRAIGRIYPGRLARVAAAILSSSIFLWPSAGAQPADPMPAQPDPQRTVVLDNARVLVEKVVLAPGQSTGAPSHPLDQLWVFVKGGVLTSSAGRATLWRDGRVSWHGASDRYEGTGTNTGTAPIEIMFVNLKPVLPMTVAAAAHAGKPKYQYLDYPNIPGEDLFENDEVIVQRFVVNPGQWEGVHAHHPDMLFIHVKGGQWAAKTYKEAEHAYPEPSPDGEVGWMPTIDLSVGHQSGNVGKEPIDLIWVTLKQ